MTHTAVMDEWLIDDNHMVVVALVRHEGRWRVDARVWFRADVDGAFHPGKGLALGIKHLERLAAAIEKTHRGAVARFLIDPPPSSQAFMTSGRPLADILADTISRDHWP
jgi:hypothetical protein